MNKSDLILAKVAPMLDDREDAILIVVKWSEEIPGLLDMSMTSTTHPETTHKVLEALMSQNVPQTGIKMDSDEN
jgi:hypothetical protein